MGFLLRFFGVVLIGVVFGLLRYPPAEKDRWWQPKPASLFPVALPTPTPTGGPGAPLASSPAPLASSLDARSDEIARRLEALPLPFPLRGPKTEANGAGATQWVHHLYTAIVPRPARLDEIEAHFQPVVHGLAQAIVRVEDRQNGLDVHFGIDGRRTHTVELRWLIRPPRVALLIGNLGDDLLIPRDLFRLGIRLNPTLEPTAPFATLITERAAAEGQEILYLLPTPITGQTAPPPPTSAAAGILLPSPPRDEAGWQAVRRALGAGGVIVLVEPTPPEEEQCRAATGGGEICLVAEVLRSATGEPVGEDPAALRAAFSLLRQRALASGDRVVLLPARPGLAAVLAAEAPAFARSGIDLVAVRGIGANLSSSQRVW